MPTPRAVCRSGDLGVTIAFRARAPGSGEGAPTPALQTGFGWGEFSGRRLLCGRCPCDHGQVY